MKKALADLVFLGAVNETVNIFGKQFEIKTLTAEEHLESTTATADFDTFSRIYALKVEILSRAVKSVDGEPIEDKFEAKKIFKEMQSTVVNRIYDEYEKIQQKQSEALKSFDEIKN